jgi:hypothetical protein
MSCTSSAGLCVVVFIFFQLILFLQNELLAYACELLYIRFQHILAGLDVSKTDSMLLSPLPGKSGSKPVSQRIKQSDAIFMAFR